MESRSHLDMDTSHVPSVGHNATYAKRACLCSTGHNSYRRLSCAVHAAIPLDGLPHKGALTTKQSVVPSSMPSCLDYGTSNTQAVGRCRICGSTSHRYNNKQPSKTQANRMRQIVTSNWQRSCGEPIKRGPEVVGAGVSLVFVIITGVNL